MRREERRRGKEKKGEKTERERGEGAEGGERRTDAGERYERQSKRGERGERGREFPARPPSRALERKLGARSAPGCRDLEAQPPRCRRSGGRSPQAAKGPGSSAPQE